MDTKEIDKHVGQKLRARRELLGISLRELAEEIGIAFQQIQKYESGKNRVGASMLYQLSCVLDVDISYFFEGYEGEDTRISFERIEYTNALKDIASIYNRIHPNMRKNMIKLMEELAIMNPDGKVE